MIKADDKVLRAFAHVAQNVPAVGEWLEAWATMELKRLPSVGKEAVAVAQGRCQVLDEIVDLIRNAPAHAAQPHVGQQRS
jgi:hypothetical protein